nr:MAG TPA: hypothetical protein [Caudoviricetes sp.]
MILVHTSDDCVKPTHVAHSVYRSNFTKTVI